MRQVVYYVASSLDGYIAGPGESIEGFGGGGSGVEKYIGRIKLNPLIPGDGIR